MGDTYLVRSGDNHEHSAFSGKRSIAELNGRGREQAGAAARSLTDGNIDLVVASPAPSSRETAVILAGVLGVRREIMVDDALDEYDVGLMEGLLRSNLTSAQLTRVPGAEDPWRFARRIVDVIYRYSAEDDNVVLVTHDGNTRMVRTIEQQDDPLTFYDAPSLPPGESLEVIPALLSEYYVQLRHSYGAIGGPLPKQFHQPDA